jgi:hypothetical protein
MAHGSLPRNFPSSMSLAGTLGSPSASSASGKAERLRMPSWRSAIPGRRFAPQSLLLSNSKIRPVWDRCPRRLTLFLSFPGEPHGCPGSLVAPLIPKIHRPGRFRTPLSPKPTVPGGPEPRQGRSRIARGKARGYACRRPGITPLTNKPCKGDINPTYKSGPHFHRFRVSPWRMVRWSIKPYSLAGAGKKS